MSLPRTSKELARLPVGTLLWRYSLPAIAGMLVMALYNVVDRLYIARCVGADGLAGFSLTFPPMMIMLAFGLLIGAGTATRISIAMGQGKRKIAHCYLGQAVCIYAILSFIIYPLLALFLEPILLATGGTPTIVPYAKSYLTITFCCGIFQYIGFGLNHTLRATGYPTKALLSQLFGAIANIILDPFFIFDEVPLGFCTLPGLGLNIQGAAIATVISQAISAIWVLSHFLNPATTLRLKLGYIRIYKPLIGGVILLGLPPFAINLVGSSINALYNILLQYHAPTPHIATLGIATVSIVMTVQMLIFMPVLGLTQGMQPILGFNYGAKHYDRMRETFRLSLWIGGGYICVVTALVLLFAEPIFSLFCKEALAADLFAYGPTRMRIFFCSFFSVGYAVVVGHYFQSIGKGTVALIMTLSRQCFMLIPMLLLFPYILGPIGIWWAAPISDNLASLVALLFHLHERKRLAQLT